MARTIIYTYKNQEKTLTFSYEKHHNIHEAVAEAEGIDLTEFLKMEMQLEAISDTKSVRNFRDNHFKKLGFGIITLQPKENFGVGKNQKRLAKHPRSCDLNSKKGLQCKPLIYSADLQLI